MTRVGSGVVSRQYRASRRAFANSTDSALRCAQLADVASVQLPVEAPREQRDFQLKQQGLEVVCTELLAAHLRRCRLPRLSQLKLPRLLPHDAFTRPIRQSGKPLKPPCRDRERPLAHQLT